MRLDTLLAQCHAFIISKQSANACLLDTEALAVHDVVSVGPVNIEVNLSDVG